MSKENTTEGVKDLQTLAKHTVGAGNLGRIKKGQYPSFGTNQARVLQLINEEEIKEAPGPGKYDLEPLNIEDLVR
jgi:hypothetical protein